MNIDVPFLQAALPLPPSVDRMYRNIRWKRADGRESSSRAATTELLTFQREALYQLNHHAEIHDRLVIEQIRAHKAKVPLKIEIVFYYKTMWKVDVDSGVKAAQDITFQFLALNDNMVSDQIVMKRVNRVNPHCKIRLSFAQIEEDNQW